MSVNPGTLHTYSTEPRLVAFEHAHTRSAPYILLFVGGLYDGLDTVPYVKHLPEKLNSLGWSVAELLLSSSYQGWGNGSVRRDATEIMKAVEHFRKLGKEKIVLFGHSTGCQDLITFFHLEHPFVDGAIFQAPVSDREYIESQIPGVDQLLLNHQSEEYVPVSLSSVFGVSNHRITYKRFASLALVPQSAEVNVDESEDFFSTNLSDLRLQNVFGPVASEVNALLLLSEKDEYYPKHVTGNLEQLGGRYQDAFAEHKAKKATVVVVKGASHNVKEDDARENLVQQLQYYLISV